MTTLAEIAKDAQSERKEQAFGLANNAFGATAGAIGTRAVYREARKKHLPGRQAAYEAKQSAKQAARAAKGPSKLAQVGAKIGSKIPQPVKRYGGPAAVAGAVGMQLANSAADAQSAAYFSRELAKGKQKHGVAKSFSENARVGRRISDSVEVSKRRFDSEADRQHRLGIYEGLGYTGGALSAAGGVYGLKRQGVKLGNIGRKLAKHKVPLAAAGAGATSVGGAVAARRAYTRDRNEAWT